MSFSKAGCFLIAAETKEGVINMTRLFTEGTLREAAAQEGRTLDRPDEQLGVTVAAKDAYNSARLAAMKSPGYHPVTFERSYRGHTG